MPRELISTRDNDDTHMKVRWSNENGSDVQVAIAVPDITIGGQAFSDVCAHLDRSEVNRLIRTLRRARDATFGADA